jgi:hypothetical protein
LHEVLGIPCGEPHKSFVITLAGSGEIQDRGLDLREQARVPGLARLVAHDLAQRRFASEGKASLRVSIETGLLDQTHGSASLLFF